MSGFAPEWLALREPYDVRARNAAVLDAVAAAFADRSAIAVVDLACGRGSTLRALSSRLPAHQDWRLVDHDPDLLREAAALPRPAGVRVTTRPLDLAAGVQDALDGSLDLITTSALLDLVSEGWLERLVQEAAARRLPVYAALTYDGRAALAPPAEGDAAIVAALNLHQRRDKGFGPALGPRAAAFATAAFAAAGFTLAHGTSDWMLTGDDRALQLEIFAGWAQAARETGTVPTAEVGSWLTARRAAVAAGRSSLRVGHVDFFARPIATR